MTRTQRIRKQLRAQDWFTVFIEVAVLVVGVFLGIQVSNWNDARKDRADEAEFLRQLQVDILSAKQLSNQIGRYRVARRGHMESAIDVLFGRSDRTELTPDECQAVYTAAFVTMPFVDIASFDELVASGRVGIVRDRELRGSLLRLQQVIAMSNRTVATLSPQAFRLARDFPELIAVESVVDTSGDRREIRGQATCDTAGMRASRAFLNQAGMNIDLYDAFFRDGFEPWQEAIDRVHARVDTLLDNGSDDLE